MNSIKKLALFLFLTLMLAGCASVVTYKANAPAGQPKPAGYPIPVYTEEMTAPRPCKVIGTVAVHNSGFTIVGGSVEAVMKAVMSRAREKGADAVQVTSIDKPNFNNPNYRITADLLRYTDAWETIAISENEFVSYLQKNRQTLDPIEGIWFQNGHYRNRIGIMKNNSEPGRNFIGFMLDPEIPSWSAGYKKMDITRGKHPGSYLIKFYLDDFSQIGTTIVLGNATTFTMVIQKMDEMKSVTYSKNQWINQ